MLIQMGKAMAETLDCKNSIWRKKIITTMLTLGICKEEMKHNKKCKDWESI